MFGGVDPITRNVDKTIKNSRYYVYQSTYYGTAKTAVSQQFWYMPLDKAPNVYSCINSFGELFDGPRVIVEFNGLLYLEALITDYVIFFWDPNETRDDIPLNINWQNLEIPATSINPRQVYFNAYLYEIAKPNVNNPSVTLDCYFKSTTSSLPYGFGLPNAPNLYASQFYFCMNIANWSIIKYNGETLNTPLGDQFPQPKFLLDRNNFEYVSQVNVIDRPPLYLENDPFTNGMRYFKEGLDKKAYYKFLHFPKTILRYKIEPDKFGFDPQYNLYIYGGVGGAFKFPENIAPYKYASLYIIPKYFSQNSTSEYRQNNTELVMYSDLVRKVRGALVPLYISNANYVNNFYGEIFDYRYFFLYINQSALHNCDEFFVFLS